jgi:hypothetical protein
VTLPYLYAHQNPHAPKRENGRRFHGYPGRSQKTRLIGVHTTESVFDLIGQDTGAEGVAAFQSRTERPSSYHRIHDRDSTVVCLPDEATAFGIGKLNSPTLHQAFALRAVDWGDPKKAAAARPMLEQAATTAAEWCREFGIPLTWLTREQAFGGARGFIRHGTADPGRRSDPGKYFPARLYFELIATRLDPKSSPAPSRPPAPPVTPPPAPVQEDEMYAVVSDPSDAKTGDYGTNGVTKFAFESQEAKNDWTNAFGAKRIELSLPAFDAIPTVGRPA